ncbi:MAG: glutathione peroxidase [Schleiferiaceae bacterium]|jgi:glutathione peroxidase|nr:glutathione peroxidase [Schleiferiaceae bacterium]
MKKIFLALSVIFLGACQSNESSENSMEKEQNQEQSQTQKTMSFYDLEGTTLMGDAFSFSSLKGKRVLIVNTASECGFTPQYTQLQELYEGFHDKNFEIIGFPANNFGKQEPGENEEIAEFCKKNFGVSFTMMEKSDVIGENTNSVYRWIDQDAKDNGVEHSVEWNFHKVMINENGHVVASYPSKVSPVDEQILNYLSK